MDRRFLASLKSCTSKNRKASHPVSLLRTAEHQVRAAPVPLYLSYQTAREKSSWTGAERDTLVLWQNVIVE